MKHSEFAKSVFDIEAREVTRLSRKISAHFDELIERLLVLEGRVVTCGMGKSGHIAKKIFATLVSTGTPSLYMHPAEAFHGDLGMIRKEDAFLVLSNSGETDEIIKIIPFLKENGNLLIALTGNPNSSIAKNAHFHIDVGVEQEACPLSLAPTSSTTCALVMGDAIALSLMQARQFTPRDFARYHPGGALGRKLLGRVKDYINAASFVAPASTLADVIKTLGKSGVGMICVGTEDKVLGVITDGDVCRTLEKSFDMNLVASEMMTENPRKMRGDILCSEADEFMKASGINSLLVCAENKVIGIYQTINKAK